MTKFLPFLQKPISSHFNLLSFNPPSPTSSSSSSSFPPLDPGVSTSSAPQIQVIELYSCSCYSQTVILTCAACADEYTQCQCPCPIHTVWIEEPCSKHDAYSTQTNTPNDDVAKTWDRDLRDVRGDPQGSNDEEVARFQVDQALREAIQATEARTVERVREKVYESDRETICAFVRGEGNMLIKLYAVRGMAGVLKRRNNRQQRKKLIEMGCYLEDGDEDADERYGIE